LKVLSSNYGPDQVSLTLSGAPDSEAVFFLKENHKDSDHHSRHALNVAASAGAVAELLGTDDFLPPGPLAQPRLIRIHFPKGEGYQTTQVTLTW
jgi:hypothetical protein